MSVKCLINIRRFWKKLSIVCPSITDLNYPIFEMDLTLDLAKINKEEVRDREKTLNFEGRLWQHLNFSMSYSFSDALHKRRWLEIVNYMKKITLFFQRNSLFEQGGI